MPWKEPGMARSRSASGRMMFGLLPLSSRVRRLSEGARGGTAVLSLFDCQPTNKRGRLTQGGMSTVRAENVMPFSIAPIYARCQAFSVTRYDSESIRAEGSEGRPYGRGRSRPGLGD